MGSQVKEKTINSNTREKILQAAYTCFSEEGYSSSSISKIAKKAKVLSGSIYWAFETKEKLFSEVLRIAGDEFLASLKVTVRFDHGKLVNADQIVERLLENFGSGPEFLRLFLAVAVEPNAGSNEVITVAKDIRTQCRTIIEEPILDAFSNCDQTYISQNAQRISTMVIQLLDGLYVATKIEGNEVDIHRYLTNIIRFIDHEVQLVFNSK